jgi:hypothetical protein
MFTYIMRIAGVSQTTFIKAPTLTEASALAERMSAGTILSLTIAGFNDKAEELSTDG